MIDLITAVLLLLGATFLLLAGLGVLRMPDLYTRMQPATKGATLGVGLMLLAVAVYFPPLGVTSRAIAGIVFFLLTAPVTAHLIGRVAYITGVPLWSGTVCDELKGKYFSMNDETATNEWHHNPTDHGEPTIDDQPRKTDHGSPTTVN